MGVDEAKHGIFPGRIRLLAILAGCISGLIGSLSMGYGFAIFPSLLILGAAVAQPLLPRSGRWIMLIGALMLSVAALPFGAEMMFYGIRPLARYHDFNALGVFTLWVMSFLLVAWCDVVLLVEAIRGSRPRQTHKT